MRMTQLIVRIPEEQKQALSLLAQQERQPLSFVVRKALDEYVALKKRGKKNDLLTLVAIAHKYKGPTGPRDLSSNYKRYLYGDKRI